LQDKGYRIYIPRLFENQDYILPSRNASILKGCLAFRTSSFKVDGRLRLKGRLKNELSLKPSIVQILITRRVSEIRRIEQTIAGIIDSLLLYSTEFFIKDQYYKILKYLVRKIFTVGTFNVPQVIKMWKDFVNYIFINYSRSDVIEQPKREKFNFFFKLIPIIKVQWTGDEYKDRQQLQALAHLISSRQLPAGDRKTETKALEKFESVVTADYKPDGEILTELYEAARNIGRRCRKAGPGPIRSAHISMTGAGSLFYSVEEGGRAKEILDSIYPILTHIPEEDGEISLPFINLKEVKGIPRWRTWCRHEIYEDHPEIDFGGDHPDTIGGFQAFRQGFDEAIGLQILCCAYISMKRDTQQVSEIPIRVLAIPEPGAKVRIVTTGPYWLYVLQQSQAHVTRAFLASHPSAESGLMRADQAWHYLYLICKARSFYKKDFACLSSDLESATDAIPRPVAVQLWRGFIDGLGYAGSLLDIAADLLLKDRLCIAPNKTFVATRGVFMGEPLTKTILTLLNLSCEEIAIRRYLNCDYDRPIQEPWRTFAVAGDDHIAIGPEDYLKGITRTHIRCGSLISPTKHAISRLVVRYCEKLIYIKNIFNCEWTPRTINDSTEMYIKSPFVDSIKVRLISPCSKNNEKYNDRNTAVGKAKSLGRTLRWLNSDLFHWKWIRMVRDRFFQRMGPLMPENTSGVYWHLLLPEHLGGVGLWLDSDIPSLCHKLPSPSKSFLVDLINGKATKEIIALFKGFTSNKSYRGYELLETDISLAKELLIPEAILGLGDPKDLGSLVREFNLQDKAAGNQHKILERLHWLSEDKIKDAILRPLLWKEILSNEAKVSAFNTETFKHRYAKLWDIVFNGNPIIDEETIKTALAFRERTKFYYCGEKLEIPIRGKIRSVNLLEELSAGLPNLNIRWTRVGKLSRPVYDPLFEQGDLILVNIVENEYEPDTLVDVSDTT
jgi:hypothetical protein